MAIRKGKEIEAMRNAVNNGLVEMTGRSIQDASELIKTAAGNRMAEVDPKNIANPFGNNIALLANVCSTVEVIKAKHLAYFLTLYTWIAESVYTGKGIKLYLRKLDEGRLSDEPYVKALRKMPGWKNAPEHYLELYIEGQDDRCFGVFSPEVGAFIPAPDFRDTSIHGISTNEYLEQNHHVWKRCHAILTALLANGADAELFNTLLAEFGGPMPAEEMTVYWAEDVHFPEYVVAEYIAKTTTFSRAGIEVRTARNPAVACSYIGRNKMAKVLGQPMLIHTGKDILPLTGSAMVAPGYAIVPPVNDVTDLSECSYELGALSKDRNSGDMTPQWIEFSAIADEVLCHKIYTRPETGWPVSHPKNIIDLAYKVPDGILSKYNYLEMDTTVESAVPNETDCEWVLYPADKDTRVIPLTSKLHNNSWLIHQRQMRVTALELKGKDGQCYGMVFPEPADRFVPHDNKVYVALDPAGSQSVLVMSEARSNVIQAVSYTDLVHAITPLTKNEMDRVLKVCAGTADNDSKYIDSLIQIFSESGANQNPMIGTHCRIWKPDSRVLFDSLKEDPGTMISAMSKIGVVSNPKEILTRSNLSGEQRQKILLAQGQYIGTVLFETICALAKKGCSIASQNLEFLISYPESGTGEGFTKQIKNAIERALENVNSYLTDEGKLVLNVNVTQFSESEASAQWHVVNPPEVFLGPTVPAITPDYGYSTHDFSLKVKEKLYSFSIPYAAQQITNATLAYVYGKKSSAAPLMKCFSVTDAELRTDAQTTLEVAMGVRKKGTAPEIAKVDVRPLGNNLHEKLGFTLALNSLFANGSFNVRNVNADPDQIKVRNIVELKLNIAVPAYADAITRAVRAGDLSPDSTIYIAPVGKGSRALENTQVGHAARWIRRITDEVNHRLGETFTGRIELLDNNDKDKLSVAEGLIQIKEQQANGRTHTRVEYTEQELVDHYLDIVYGTGDSVEKQDYCDQLRESKGPATQGKYKALREALYDRAFDSLVEAYHYEDFESSYNRWGYLGTEEGRFDDEIRNKVRNSFVNLRAQVQQDHKALVMSCPGIEKEMLCGAILDMALNR